MRRWDSFFVVVVAIAIGAAACGSDRTGGPRGAPQAVVDATADRTVAAGGAAFDATAPDGERKGQVTFGSGADATGPSTGKAGEHPELVDPASVVDLVRGALSSVAYGGAAVRGTSTFRYETVINVERAVAETPPAGRPRMEAFARALGAPAFYADVWIDADGRLRRVQVPVDKTTKRPPDRSTVLPRLVTVDFFDFSANAP